MDPQQPVPAPINPTPQPAAPVPPTPAPVTPAPAPTPQPPANPAAPAPAVAAALPNVPTSWPGAQGVYQYSKQAVKRNLGTLLGLWIITLLIGVVFSAIFKKDSPIQFVGDVMSFFVSYAIIKATFASVRGQEISLGGAFATINILTALKLIVSYLVVGLALMGALLLLIVPFIILFPRLIMTPYLVIDRNLGPFAAIKASWALSKGHSDKIWGVFGLSVAISLLFITIVGIPFALYLLFMYSAAFVILYEYLHASQATPVAAVTPPAPTVAPQPPVV